MKNRFVVKLFAAIIVVSICCCLFVCCDTEPKYTAEDVVKMIDAINAATPENANAIKEASDVYASLSEEDRAAVGNYAKLMRLSYELVAADITSSSVAAMIDALGAASLETEFAIEDAFAAYCLLSAEEKAKVTNYDKLVGLRNDVAKLYVTKERRADDRIDRSKLLIGTYCFNSSDEQKVKELADCNIDFVAAVPYKTDMLELLDKYGIGAFVSAGYFVPTWKGGDRYASDIKQPVPPFSVDDFKAAAEKIPNNDAIWGLELVDEPHATDFTYFADYTDVLYEVCPQYEVYINLFPNYANQKQLGTRTYEAHVKKYVETIDTDFISYDHYLYDDGTLDGSTNEDGHNLFVEAIPNMEIVAEACKNSDRDFWIVLQVNSSDYKNEATPLTETMLRLQAVSALAYGAKVINWACWQPGWWDYNVLDAQGNKTEQYDKLKSVNEDLRLISPIFMRYNWLNAGLIDNEAGTKGVFKDVKSGGKAIGGYFNKNVGAGGAAMFTNVTDPMAEPSDATDVTVTFSTVNANARVTAYRNGVAERIFPDASGVYSLDVQIAEGVFVTVD